MIKLNSHFIRNICCILMIENFGKEITEINFVQVDIYKGVIIYDFVKKEDLENNIKIYKVVYIMDDDNFIKDIKNN